MRLLLPFLLALSLLEGADPAITQVKAVYLMPMGNGLDQYLASELSRGHVFDIVTDPALADAVLTDRIGPAFEQALAELYPPPPSPEKEPAAAERNAAGEMTVGEALSDRPEVGRRISSFSRGRGNVFLVDRRTKRVLWSDFLRPKSGRAEEVNRTADKLVDRLQADLARLRNPQK